MSELIAELKADHTTLKQILKQAADIRVPAIDRAAILSQAKMALLSHLDKENRELYPKLKLIAKNDPALQSTMETFAKDMEDIARQALEFFDKYGDPALVGEQLKNNVHYSIQFGADLERLVTLLGLRIGREERILYPQYDRVGAEMKAA